VGVCFLIRQKKWTVLQQDENLVKHISQKFGISDLVARLILNRGIENDSDILAFINNTEASQFLDPFLMSNMKKATDKILQAIECGKKIAVYGDYDVDGITSTYMLYDYLVSIGADATFYIPDRADEGYGINTGAIDKLLKSNVSLVVTVDVGITAVNEVEYAREKGIEFIITDHHTPKEIIPDAVAVINPKIEGDMYPNKNLAGVGVAYKLVYALSGCAKDVMDKYAEIAAIGTIADMVPLIGENRFIAAYGIKMLANTSSPGLNALMEVASIDKSQVDSSNISFGIAPRLNAAGRIASAVSSVRLFTERDMHKAREIAEYLDEGNKLRQKEELQILTEAIEIIESRKLYEDDVIIVAKENWHHGVIGIVSSKITEKYYKPSAVISISPDGSAKASGRSISGFNLFDALSACASYLTKFGGHDLAAGFSLDACVIDEFRIKINEYASQIMTDEILTPHLQIDSEIDISDLELGLARQLKILEPYGVGNKQPFFCINDATVRNIKIHKSGKHAFINLEKKHHRIEAPAFNLADVVSAYSNDEHICIAGMININTFRGTDNVQFLVRDLHYDEKSRLSPENLRTVYKYLLNYINHGIGVFKIKELCNALKLNSSCFVSADKINSMLDIFEELGLLVFKRENDMIGISKGEHYGEKCDLTQSELYNKLISSNL